MKQEFGLPEGFVNQEFGSPAGLVNQEFGLPAIFEAILEIVRGRSAAEAGPAEGGEASPPSYAEDF